MLLLLLLFICHVEKNIWEIYAFLINKKEGNVSALSLWAELQSKSSQASSRIIENMREFNNQVKAAQLN